MKQSRRKHRPSFKARALYYTLPMPPDGRTAEKIGVLPIVTFGGADGIRTHYLLNAIEELSLLSYSPTARKFSRKAAGGEGHKNRPRLTGRPLQASIGSGAPSWLA